MGLSKTFLGFSLKFSQKRGKRICEKAGRHLNLVRDELVVDLKCISFAWNVNSSIKRNRYASVLFRHAGHPTL